ncbi:MAG: DNA methyltransferase, partial [Bacteroidetes bacterium]|nr:DNA methyltransferase [Bacteroidota bacterium]
PQGLADTSKTTIKVNTQNPDARSATGYKQVEQEVHKVQLLDPATGTGTFLAEVIKHIHKKFEGQQGIWSNYVEQHLLPRLNGFELLMASYAMAHLKLDLLLTETGFTPTSNQRFRVYLTNSLEEHHQDTGTLFANWLSSEANEANHIKRDTPVMCVIGNPPYAVSSTNKNDWIENLIADYKKDLNEKSYNSLSDDYVKFIRYGQHYIEKNGSGVLAYISNNSFIDGIVFRQMRKHLLECFDKIYILDLHGNSKKKEISPDGSPDQNVFDIMQGVSINIFVKIGIKKKNDLGQVFKSSLFGRRTFKYEFLNSNGLNSLNWNIIKSSEPNHFFVEKDFKGEEEYLKGISVNELFTLNNVGVVTARDAFTLHFSKQSLFTTIQKFMSLTDEESRTYFGLGRDARDWKISNAKKDIEFHFPDKGLYTNLNYRPFDKRWTFYTGQSRGFHSYPRKDVMRHMLQNNLALIAPKQAIKGFKHVFISKNICDKNYTDSAGQFGAGNVFPLYLYSEPNPSSTAGQALQQSIDQPDTSKRTPNLNPKIVQQIAQQLGLDFVPDHEAIPQKYSIDVPPKPLGSTFVRPGDWGYQHCFTPLDLLDYIYAVLHSPTYREKYKEFLKIDFPRVPYPKDKETFWQLVKLGEEIRQIHLLESPKVEQYITQYPIDGDNEVGKPKYVPIPKNEETGVLQGNVYINDTQYFANVPLTAWKFYIGGYQPAQKWLKDRKDRKLEFDDILHYQKIIVALSETDRLMKEIDKIEIIVNS